MRRGASPAVVLATLAGWSAPAAAALPTHFEHVVVIVQENRTPDNLFQGLCTQANACSITPTAKQYDIQTGNWLDKTAPGGVIQPTAVELAARYDISHTHWAFVVMCDLDHVTGACQMDNAASLPCQGTCPPNPQFVYVDNSTGTLDPYLALATHYGWANYMFQTNQGPSFPAHQYIFGATSAPSAADDAIGTFASENGGQGQGFRLGGCASAPGRTVQLIDSAGVENPDNEIFPCFEHDTVPDLLAPGSITWRYYTPGQNSIWSAPNAIKHICKAHNEKCEGTMWTANVDLSPADVLKDISRCSLRNASWVIPTGQNSDHPRLNKGGGPSWVASVVNAIGTSACKDGNRSYWDDTAIVILWDDWGGFYDHEPPTFLQAPQGGYQMGFRVPMIVVSAYTPAGYIDNTRHDFGSIIRFIEQNFKIAEGSLNFADARASTDLLTFFDFARSPRAFQPIPAKYDANYFLNDTSAPLPPDDD